MMKRIFAIVVGALLILTITPLFAGGTKAQSGSGVTTIRVWTDSASDKSVREQQVARFNEGAGKEKGIKIEYTVYGTNYHELIRNATMSGNAPEIFRATGEDIIQFTGAGYLVPIAELPGGQELIDRYKPGDLQKNSQIFNGKVYSFPYSMTTFKLIINKDMFDAAGITPDKYPQTWAELRTVAKQLTNTAKGQFGFITGLQSPWVMRSYLTMPNAINIGNTGFNNGTLQFEWAKNRVAVEAVHGMVIDGSVFPGFEGLDADMMRARFSEGNIGMIFGASFDCGVYNNQFPAKCNWVPIDLPTDVRGAPKYRDFVDASNLLTIGVAGKKEPEKVMEVFKFFYSDENLAELYEAGLYVPFRQEAVALAKNEPSAKGFKEFASVPNPAISPASPENIVQVEGLTYRETLQKIFAKGYSEPPAQVLADLEKRYNDAVAKLAPNVREDFRATVDFTRK
jgi:multiple sugar transport system substrate-binding protein